MGKGGKKRGERHSTMIRGGCTMYYCARGGGGGGGKCQAHYDIVLFRVITWCNQ